MNYAVHLNNIKIFTKSHTSKLRNSNNGSYLRIKVFAFFCIHNLTGASANRPAFNAITRQENGTIRVEEKSKGRRTLAPKQQNSRISLEGVPKRIRINQSKRHVRRSGQLHHEYLSIPENIKFTNENVNSYRRS
ncbi:hypothetical protein T4B_349 [Trichinella pseudospiralis]|uniref:Uncharacterized protein n=1 Tax=Trichinella pseudospiralis TaxID=6337 RepID=A0A0V1J799_TRIPS|nr:hypothetical protein T4A_2815 [Trichinella pseudospiralis]KRZ30866.1 hypothetical protein T4B_349 [Trichinella pseudospiralis]